MQRAIRSCEGAISFAVYALGQVAKGFVQDSLIVDDVVREQVNEEAVRGLQLGMREDVTRVESDEDIRDSSLRMWKRNEASACSPLTILGRQLTILRSHCCHAAANAASHAELLI